MERVGKKELVTLVAERTGLPKKEVAQIYDALIEAIREQVKAGNTVNVKGLGIFRPVEKSAREVRNPQTGGKVQVPAKVVLKFKPARSVKVLKVLG